MRHIYIRPEIQVCEVSVVLPISSSLGEEEHYQGGDLDYGGGTGESGIKGGDARRRGSSYSGGSYSERNGGWKSGGLW